MLRKLCSRTAIGCLSVLALSFATADEPASGKLNDEEFVTKAAIGGSTEVALAKLAQQRATEPEVKKFAEKMVTDHTKANNELLTLAGQKRIAVPAQIDPKHQECLDLLGKLEGSEFDRQYKMQMLKDHKTTLDLFENEAKDGRDADLKAFANKLVPTLRHHLMMAKQLNGEKDDAVGTTSAEAPGSKDSRSKMSH